MKHLLILSLIFFLSFITLSACEGPQGPEGSQGPAGVKGDQGEPGEDGEDGSGVGTLNGTVSDSDGNALEGVSISTDPETYSTTTDSSGFFILSGLSEGSYTVNASLDGYESGSTTAAVSGGEITEVSITLDPALSDIDGTVTDTGDNPIEGATVTLYQFNYGTWGYDLVDETVSGTDGSFSFIDLGGGVYHIYVTSPDSNLYLDTETHDSVSAGSTVSLKLNTNTYGNSYRGSTYCLTCHDGGVAEDRTGWSASLHALMIRAPGETTSLQDLSNFPDADNGLAYFVPGNDNDNTGDEDEYGYVYDYSSGGYYVYLGEDSNGYFFELSDQFPPNILSDRFYIVFTQGNRWKQRYWTRLNNSTLLYASTVSSSTSHYPSPMQYNIFATGTEDDPFWVTYHPERWQAPAHEGGPSASSSMSYTKSWEAGCMGCHSNAPEVSGDTSTGFSGSSNSDTNGVLDLDGDGDTDELNIGCERCHGPGGAHAGDPEDIINPEYLSVQASNELCGQCHVRGTSADPTSFKFPYNDSLDGMFLPGIHSLDDFYTISSLTSINWKEEDHSTATIYAKKHHQQYVEFQYSLHYDNPYHMMNCFTCHSSHERDSEGQIIGSMEVSYYGTDYEIENLSSRDNTLCLSCHAGYGPFAGISKDDVMDVTEGNDNETVAEVVTEHMFDEVGMGGQVWYDPDGEFGFGSCISCHMVKTAKSARYTYDESGLMVEGDVRSHTFVPVMPIESYELAAAGGNDGTAGNQDVIPNSCGACHEDFRYSD